MLRIVPLTATIMLRAVVLHGIGGVLFVRLYWKRGRLLAMSAHLSAVINL